MKENTAETTTSNNPEEPRAQTVLGRNKKTNRVVLTAQSINLKIETIDTTSQKQKKNGKYSNCYQT